MKEEEIVKLLEKARITCIKQGDYSETERLCNLVIHYFENLKEDKSLSDLRFLAQAYIISGHSCHESGKYKDAALFGEKALALAVKAGLKNEEAETYLLFANIFNYQSDYLKALDYYKRSLKIYEELDDLKGIANNISNIGSIYASLSEYKQALKWYKKSLALFQKIGLEEGVASILGALGIIYTNLSENSTALKYFNRAVVLHKALNNKPFISNVFGNISKVYKQLLNYKEAISYLEKAIEIDEELGNKRQLAHWYGGLGKILLEKDPPDLTGSETSLKKSISISEEIGIKNQLAKGYKIFARLNRKKEKWKKAGNYFRKFHEIDKEIHSEEVIKQAKQFAQEREVIEKEKELAIQQAAAKARHQATQALLHKVLPNEIANRMLSGEEEIADHYPEVSILFADIKGFTPLTSNMPAQLVIRLLNSVFNRFDEIIKKHGCTKIKTLGDGYMAVAGAPKPCDDHSERLVKAAFEIIEDIQLPEEINEHIPKGTGLKVRVGLHVGPVVAGVIGQDRFVYDIYSDAVNIASRMESHGEEGRIHISEEFMNHLADRSKINSSEKKYNFESRGELDVKGKGKMKTCFINKAI